MYYSIRNARRQTAAAIVLSLFAGCAALGDPESAELSTDISPLYVAGQKIWQKLDIPVCWENPTDSTARTWVRNAVETTWEASSRVDFTGWGTCTSTSDGIRIEIADINSRTLALGRDLDGLPTGMALDFTFINWNTSCQGANRQFCIQAIAIHEFGHALGFAHEQNRSDTPSNCTDPPQGQNGDTTVGPWDGDSVMNYCAGYRTTLSAGDITGVRQYYGSSTFSGNRKAAVEWDNGKIYFFNGPQYTRYNVDGIQPSEGETDSGYPQTISAQWGNWPASWTDGVDAAVNWGNGKAYFFRGSNYIRMDVPTKTVDAGYPQPIAANWTGWPSSWTSVDAAVRWDNGKAYFFRGSNYLRMDIATKTVDAGYPKPISAHWPGLFTSDIDYAVNTGAINGKAYFFKGTQYTRYDMASLTADPGYPKLIVGRWPGVPF